MILLHAISPLLFLALSRMISAQSTPRTTITTTINFFPTGVQTENSSLESIDPIPCSEACYLSSLSTYSYVSRSSSHADIPSYCFINSTLPNGDKYNTSLCDTYLCNNTLYEQVSGCLNCIVANGNEKPFGYYTNSSMTALPTNTGGGNPLSADARIYNPWGLINATVSNDILKNISDHCASVSSSITVATTVTATPTTT